MDYGLTSAPAELGTERRDRAVRHCQDDECTALNRSLRVSERLGTRQLGRQRLRPLEAPAPDSRHRDASSSESDAESATGTTGPEQRYRLPNRPAWRRR